MLGWTSVKEYIELKKPKVYSSKDIKQSDKEK